MRLPADSAVPAIHTRRRCLLRLKFFSLYCYAGASKLLTNTKLSISLSAVLRIETFEAAAQNLNASHVARHYLNVAGTAREKKFHDVITHLPYSDPLLGVRRNL